MLCLEMSLKGSSTVTSLSVTQVKMAWVGAEMKTGFRSSGGVSAPVSSSSSPFAFLNFGPVEASTDSVTDFAELILFDPPVLLLPLEFLVFELLGLLEPLAGVLGFEPVGLRAPLLGIKNLFNKF